MSQYISRLRAVVYALLGFTVWSVADGFTKLVGQTRLPPAQILVMASLFCVVTIFSIMAAQGKVAMLKPKRWKLELVRAMIYTLSSFANVAAFTYFPITTVYVALFTSPMLVALFASLFLREPLSWPQGLVILSGFGGVVLALGLGQADFGNSTVMASLALIVFPILVSGNVLFIRFLGRTEHSESMAFFPLLMRMLFVLPFFAPYFQPMTAEQVLYLAGLGSLGAFGSLLMMDALKHAPAAIVWPFQYSQLVAGAILGYFIWHEAPSLRLVAGSAVIIASGLYLAHHARRAQLIAALSVKV